VFSPPHSEGPSQQRQQRRPSSLFVSLYDRREFNLALSSPQCPNPRHLVSSRMGFLSSTTSSEAARSVAPSCRASLISRCPLSSLSLTLLPSQRGFLILRACILYGGLLCSLSQILTVEVRFLDVSEVFVCCFPRCLGPTYGFLTSRKHVPVGMISKQSNIFYRRSQPG
jgi:hypothetical protein